MRRQADILKREEVTPAIEGKVVRQLIRSAGAKLLFCPISPDLNPIAQVFAKLERFLRNAAARTVEAVCLLRSRFRREFAPVYGWFAEGLDTRDLHEARAMLGGDLGRRCTLTPKSHVSPLSGE
jgi:hypothetical protein